MGFCHPVIIVDGYISGGREGSKKDDLNFTF
jgi:hypothetical protein